MSKFARNISILIVAIMLGVALASCGTPTEVATTEPPVEPTTPVVEEPTAEPEPTEPEPTEVVFEEQPFGENLPTEPTIDTPLVVAYQDFSQKFSPFFADTGYDMDVANMTQISIMTTDRVGALSTMRSRVRPTTTTAWIISTKVRLTSKSNTTKPATPPNTPPACAWA